MARTLVMAAVKLVLPWSTCPMVPMLTCGLLRSNFSLAMVWFFSSTIQWCGRNYPATNYLADPVALDHFIDDVLRCGRIPVEFHRETAASLRHTAEVGRVAEHFAQRDGRSDRRCVAAARIHALDERPARGEIANDCPGILFRYDNFHLHHRLKQ